MKDTTTSVLGFDVPVSGQPTTLPECITAAGGEQQMVDGWVDYRNYHGTNSDARSAVVDALTEVTGISRATETVPAPTKADPNKTTEKYSESEQTFRDRVLAEMNWTKEQAWAAIKDKVGVVPFKGQGTGRAGGPGRVGKEDALFAKTIIDAGEDSWMKAIDILETKNPGLKVDIGDDGKPVLESLAAAFRTNRARINAEAKAEFQVPVAA